MVLKKRRGKLGRWWWSRWGRGVGGMGSMDGWVGMVLDTLLYISPIILPIYIKLDPFPLSFPPFPIQSNH